MTSFKPDQMSSIAQTLTSTKPKGRATSRTVFSVTLLGTPELRLGHETQTIPSR